MKSIHAAEVLLASGDYPDAVSRAYYAIFYAAYAAGSADEAPESKTHKGAIHVFFKHFIQGGELEAEWVDVFTRAFAARQAADYDILSNITVDDARMRCFDARAFVERIRRYLLDKGFSAEQLPLHPAKQDPSEAARCDDLADE